jgi:hypothetical protein
MDRTVTTEGRLRGFWTRRRARRRWRTERRVRDRKARQLARERRRGTVRVRTRDYVGEAAKQRLYADLPRELLSWSRDRAMRFVDVRIPLDAEPEPGRQFTVQGRTSDGRNIYIHCTIGRRFPWRQTTDAVNFSIMESQPEVRLPRVPEAADD